MAKGQKRERPFSRRERIWRNLQITASEHKTGQCGVTDDWKEKGAGLQDLEVGLRT